MQLQALLVFLLPFAVSAGDICAYAEGNCGTGTYGCCTDLSLGDCCSWDPPVSSPPLGTSVGWSNISSTNNFGIIYAARSCDTSSQSAGSLPTIGDACLTGEFVASSATIGILGTKKMRRGAATTCKQPDKLVYHDASGEEKVVAVAEGKFSEMLAAVERKDFQALEG